MKTLELASGNKASGFLDLCVCRFKKAQFRICAFAPKTDQTREKALSDVHSLEVKLLGMQSSVSVFQKEYLKVSSFLPDYSLFLACFVFSILQDSSSSQEEFKFKAKTASRVTFIWRFVDLSIIPVG